MRTKKMKFVICGLSITSSWGNGHAATYRGLAQGLAERGHDVLFLERDKPGYASYRDLPNPARVRTELYTGLKDLDMRFKAAIKSADFVMIGSSVQDGVALADWVLANTNAATAYYDIDTPVTLAKLERGDTEHIGRHLIPKFDMYLSFTGGPTLALLEDRYGAKHARALHGSVDPAIHYPEHAPSRWDLGYIGGYSRDRQTVLDDLMLQPARVHDTGRFAVAGSQYPEIVWPSNVERIEHVPSAEHRKFYNSQRFTMSVTRRDMIRAGFSPSVNLFEAAACGTPIISDYWRGMDEFFEPKSEVLVSHGPEDTLDYIVRMREPERRRIGHAARMRVLAEHTTANRGAQLESYARELLGSGRTAAEVQPSGFAGQAV